MARLFPQLPSLALTSTFASPTLDVGPPKRPLMIDFETLDYRWFSGRLFGFGGSHWDCGNFLIAPSAEPLSVGLKF